MRRTIAALAVIGFLVAATAGQALYLVTNAGTWPKTWPEELEPLRKQSRTLEGPQILRLHYEIPFTKREEFEAAWPHLLKVRSPGTPLLLVRGPDSRLGTTIPAGVRIYAPPRSTDKQTEPEAPIPGQAHARATWMSTTFIELVVDGEIVDLNRLPLPADTLIIDERFKEKSP